MNKVGCATADLARKVGDETTYIARRIGPKRAIIGFAVIGAAVGGTIMLVRYLRSRQDVIEESELPEGVGTARMNKKARKRARKANATNAAMSP